MSLTVMEHILDFIHLQLVAALTFFQPSRKIPDTQFMNLPG